MNIDVLSVRQWITVAALFNLGIWGLIALTIAKTVEACR